MNSKQMKPIRRKARHILVEWLQSLLSKEEATKIIDTLIKQKKAMYITPEESYKARSY